MTPVRSSVRFLALVVGVLTLLLGSPRLVLADPGENNPAGATAEAPAEQRDPPATTTDEAPDASVAGHRSWLSERNAPAPAPAVDSGVSIRSILLSLLFAVAGGGAFYYQRRKNRTAPATSLAVKVLGSAKVGPRAFVVVTAVGSHTLLLGVTDGSVRRLAWLSEAPGVGPEDNDTDPGDTDDLPEIGSRARFEHLLEQRLELAPATQELEVRPREQPHSRQRPAAREEATPAREEKTPTRETKVQAKSRSFRDLVLRTLNDSTAARPAPASTGRRSARGKEPSGPAELIAAETRDIIQTGRTLHIEGQAAGLAARLQGRG